MKSLFLKILIACVTIFVCYLVIFKFFSVIISTGCVALVGYFALYKCCEILLSRRDTDFSGLMKEFGVIGVARIILETFEVVGSSFREFAGNLVRREKKIEDDNDFFTRIIALIHDALRFCLKRLFFQKNDKPIMKISKKDDLIILFNFLIELARSEKTASFKEVVERNWRDKWSYFAHSNYLYEMGREISVVCADANLPSLMVLITYNNGKLVSSFFQKDNDKREHGNGNVSKYADNFENIDIKGINNVESEVLKKYLSFFSKNFEKYIKLLASLKDRINK